jgi:hypothetical protein
VENSPPNSRFQHEKCFIKHMFRRAKTREYSELNQGADGLLFGKRFNQFYKRIETTWIQGKANDSSGIHPRKFDGNNLEFVLDRPGRDSLVFNTQEMDNAAALVHCDLFRRYYKREAEQWANRAMEMVHDSAVSELMKMDTSFLDVTEEGPRAELSDYLTRAKRHAKEMGIEL